MFVINLVTAFIQRQTINALGILLALFICVHPFKIEFYYSRHTRSAHTNAHVILYIFTFFILLNESTMTDSQLSLV